MIDFVVRDKNLYTSIGFMIVSSLTYMLSIENSTALSITSFILFLLIIYFIATELKELRDGKAFATTIVLVGMLIWYFYPALIYSTLIDEQVYKAKLNEEFSYAELYKSLFLICIFTASFIAVNGIRIERNNVSNHTCKGVYENKSRILKYAALFSVLGMLPILASGVSVSDIIDLLLIGRGADKPWVHSKNIGNQTSGLYYLLRCLCYGGVMLMITYTINIKDKIHKKVPYAVLGLFVLVVISVDSGTRSLSMIAILPGLALLLQHKLETKPSLTVLVRAALILLCLVFLLQVQLILRNEFTNDKDFWELFSNDILLLRGTIDYFVETLYSVLIVPSRHDYFLEFDLVYFSTFPIPRFIWADKPVSDIVWFYTMQRWGVNIYNESGNIFPGIVGQYYMSLGYLGPSIIGVFYAFVCKILDLKIYIGKINNAILYQSLFIMYAVWLFVSFRFFSPGFLFPVIMAHLIIVLSKLKINNKWA